MSKFETDLITLARQKTDSDAKIKPWQRELKLGDFFYYYSDAHRIVIWGEVIENQTDFILHGYRTCRCFTVGLDEGVVGDVHISVIHKTVTSAIFEKARKAGWPHDEVTFTRFAAQLQDDRERN